MQKQFMITEDGSHTIYLPEMDEHYHSFHGAFQESRHVYIENGLFYMTLDEISILEIGFGTGLNAYLTYCYAIGKKLKINYSSIEKYPLSAREYVKLNYPTSIFPEHSLAFEKMHQADWNEFTAISPEFKLQKLNADLLTYQFDSSPKFDLVYYDAFAPGKQPEMWTDELLHRIAATVKKDGVLVTYCAKGAVRRAFSAAGFLMERLPGPTGKKEILRGKKTI